MERSRKDTGGIQEHLPSYAERLGERLRAVRRQRGLSLQKVQEASKDDFRTSILGAYERGERVLSVARLHRLCQLYDVPVDQVLPRAATEGADWEQSDDSLCDCKLTLDLAQLARREFPDKPIVSAFARGIQLQRQDFRSPVITLRNGDVRIIAGVLALSVNRLHHRLRESGIAL